MNVKDSPASTVHIACVDDDPRIVMTEKAILKRLGCRVSTYTDPEICWGELQANPVDIVVTDLDMPGIDGITLMKRIRSAHPSTDIIVVTGNADKTVAINALRLGAYDFFEKPLDPDDLIETVKRTMKYRSVVQERDRYAEQVSELSRQEAQRWGIDAFVGKSAGIKAIISEIKKLHRVSGTSVLVTGESGTGKELVARAIHFGGVRSKHPFVPVNCSAVPAELVESTLFGHVKGAFTGAVKDKKGAFVMADKGTLFLDEIGDMPSEMQTKLLRVLEDGVVLPVGGTTEQRVDVRVVAATNADLQSRIAEGAFRSDLFYRIAGYSIHMPPLRERADDIPLLAQHFVDKLSNEMGLPTPVLSSETIAALQHHRFTGNIRELKNIIERALIECDGASIESHHLFFVAPAVPSGLAGAVDDDESLDLERTERMVIAKAMAKAEGNVSQAARLLGINRSKLYRKLAAASDEH